MRIGDYKASYAHDEALFDTPTQRAWLVTLVAAALASAAVLRNNLLVTAQADSRVPKTSNMRTRRDAWGR
jgi:hypothetical protein